MAQTEIPVPPAPHARAELTDSDKAALYRKEIGAEAFERQTAAAYDASRCTCGVGDREPVAKHKPGCHRIPLKAGRR